MTIDNHLIIEPLSILDWKWDMATAPPTKLALVQWVGLPPEDTTWEDLCASYNLEDKVDFQEGGDDSNTTLITRPKRTQKRSTYLSDYA